MVQIFRLLIDRKLTVQNNEDYVTINKSQQVVT